MDFDLIVAVNKHSKDEVYFFAVHFFKKHLAPSKHNFKQILQ